jgi:predicted AlkP superfamily pyrophosphatase or phosphodiesterase
MMFHSLRAGVVAVLVAMLVQMPAGAADRGGDAHDGRPVLVVGIVIDQFRPDLLERYWDLFDEGGFKRLLGGGYAYTNAHFTYMPTATGPGHATIYSGALPSVHGIIGNRWYLREAGREVDVVLDDDVAAVGVVDDKAGASPHRLLTTTIGDELYLHTNGRSTVIGVSIKARGAILPAGHTGQAYWLHEPTGRIMTSTHYRAELPAWVEAFNERDLVGRYLSAPWDTLLPLDGYRASIADDNPYEARFRGQDAPVFPHDLPRLQEAYGRGELVASTPFGDELLTELALAAIDGESLGRNGTTDVLAIGYSSPDIIGHRFGPASVEVQDTFLRLDRQIARLLLTLDRRFGRDHVLVFLTADHGVVHVPAFLADQGIPAGNFDGRKLSSALVEHLTDRYGENLFVTASNYQLFLDRERIAARGLDLGDVQRTVARFLVMLPGVAGALPSEALQFSEFTQGIPAMVQRGFHPKRSGDVSVWLEPQWGPVPMRTGTNHGSPYAYDSHVPLVWYGAGIERGRSARRVDVTAIAPTLATLLRAPLPSGALGNVLTEIVDSEPSQ